MKEIINDLKSRKSSSTVNNFYSNSELVDNLIIYLEYLMKNKPSVALIGEAPGYKGCVKTGIPFTSQRILNNSDNIFFRRNQHLLNIKGDVTENTASTVWNSTPDSEVPLMWNIFPYHPHNDGQTETNRKPNKTEMSEGLILCLELIKLIKPLKIIAVGKVAEESLSNIQFNVDVEFFAARHPSYGGVKKFVSKYNQILKGDI